MQDAERAVADATLQYQAAQAQLQVLKLGPRPEAIAEAQAKIATADAFVQSAQAELDARTVRAPIDGVLDSLSAQIGQTISAGAPIGQIVDTKQLMVIAWLPAQTGSLVKVGQQTDVSVATPKHDNFDTNSGKTAKHIQGTVVFVGRVVDSQSGNLPVHILVDNSNSSLTAGQTVEASIVVDAKDNVVAIPLAGLCDAGNGPVINIVREGKSTIAHPTLGIHDGSWAEILGTDSTTPLKPGEPVIVEGGYNLPEGTAVSATDASSESAAAGVPPDSQDRLK